MSNFATVQFNSCSKDAILCGTKMQEEMDYMDWSHICNSAQHDAIVIQTKWDVAIFLQTLE